MRPSRTVLILGALVHLGGLIALLFLPRVELPQLNPLRMSWPHFDLVMQTVLAFALGVSAFWYLRSYNQRYQLQWRADGRWEVRYQSGDKRGGKLLRGTRYNRFYVNLVLRTGQSRIERILIARDSVDPEEYRTLLMRMKIELNRAIRGEAVDSV